jgi:hypothetical protein
MMQAEWAAVVTMSAVSAYFIWRARHRLESLKLYSCSRMTAEEVSFISVPIGDVERHLLAVMEKYGCALVTGVAQDAELEELERLMHNDLVAVVDEDAVGALPPSILGDFARFKNGTVQDFPAPNVDSLTASGLLLKKCFAHGKMAWRVRKHPNIHRAFAALYPDDPGPLVSSLDVPLLSRDLGGVAPLTNPVSAHMDQNLNDARAHLRDCAYYQGIFYVWGAEAEEASTTVVWPGSHNDKELRSRMMSDENFKNWGAAGEHYCAICDMKDERTAADIAAAWGKAARRVPAPRGSLFLWSTKTLHTGWQAGKRLAQAVALSPKSERPEHERLAKLRLAALGLPSTHWAHVGMQHDMVLRDMGYFGLPADAAESQTRRENTLGALPMRSAIRPFGLHEDAPVAELEILARNTTFSLCGMWWPSEEERVRWSAVLEASVKDECKDIL